MKWITLQKHGILVAAYSLLGAVLEHVAYAIDRKAKPLAPQKTLDNPILTGFPLYAIGAYTVVGLSKLGVRRQSLPVQFLVYALALSAIEVAAGYCIDAGVNSYTNDGRVRAWDYSGCPGSFFGGKIDLKHMLIWGGLGLLIANVIHPILERKAEAAAKV